MKKTLTHLLLTAALAYGTAASAMAQSAYFSYQGKKLANGATVTIEAEDDGWGGMACETNPAANAMNGLLFVNATAQAISGKANLTITKNTLKPYQIQWCMGGTCQLVKANTFDKEYAVPAKGSIPVQYDAILDEDDLRYGEMESTISTKVGGETVTVNIVFTYTDPANVAALGSQKPVALEYFTLDGRSCHQKQPHGVALARFSDGKVRKVIKKD